MKKMICAMAALTMLATACKDKGEQFEINGRIAEADGKTLYFEAVTLNGIEALDSTRLDEDGQFCFQGTRPFNPEFYRLRIDRQIVNLSVDSTETIHVEAELPDMGTDYEVEGSGNCQTLKEINNKLIALQQSIKDITNDKALTLGEQERLVHEKINLYKNEMKMHYIMENPASAPAYFALFQTVNGSLIFNPISNPDDIKFVGAVATAWDANYPGTSRTENLHNIAIQGMKNTKRPTPVSLEDIDPGKISAAGIIDIELPDIHGKNRKLSDIRNKVVLLDFTAYSLPSSQERIMQMRGLYDKYSSLGFDIYQVSIDPDEHYWKTACEHLPWTCVYESRGEASGYLGSYLVRRLPTYFLINRHGDLVARDEQIDDLEKTIRLLCE
ncbi:TlpA disulfide reductase family protein [Paraprevotella clara]|jgi:antioxidant, ahpC/TSA family|uniref:Thiol-disulfide oxidoreductase n=1 Tax=Paraprevotella clara TaxID=454154 RepID=A0A6N3DCP0_9BACT|nr:TlpA disulfide reductase family protein [Paraprevotella clara]MBS6983545.1 AhpC/TSA family protein [Paraprevotella clara]